MPAMISLDSIKNVTDKKALIILLGVLAVGLQILAVYVIPRKITIILIVVFFLIWARKIIIAKPQPKPTT